MGAHLTLLEQDGTIGIDPAGDQCRRHFANAIAQRRRVLCDRDRMQVDDAIDALMCILHRHPFADGAEIIAQVQIAGGLDAGKNAAHADVPLRVNCALSSARVNRPRSRAAPR